MARNIVYVLAFVGIISSALARTCFECDSSQSQLCNYGIFRFFFKSVDCNDYLGGSSLTKWVSNEFKCITFAAKGKNGGELVARGCMPFASKCKAAVKVMAGINSLIDESGIDDMECTPCEGDDCNATPLAVLLGAIAGFVGVLVMACCCCCCRKKKPKVVIVTGDSQYNRLIDMNQ